MTLLFENSTSYNLISESAVLISKPKSVVSILYSKHQF